MSPGIDKRNLVLAACPRESENMFSFVKENVQIGIIGVVVIFAPEKSKGCYSFTVVGSPIRNAKQQIAYDPLVDANNR